MIYIYMYIYKYIYITALAARGFASPAAYTSSLRPHTLAA